MIKVKGISNYNSTGEIYERMNDYYLSNGYAPNSDKISKLKKQVNILNSTIRQSNGNLEL